MTRPQPDLAKQLGYLYGEIRKGRAQQVLTEVETLCKRFADEPNVLHLTALAYQNCHLFDSAFTYFEKSLAIAANQPEVLNNLGNLCGKTGKVDEAQLHYRRAIVLQPKFFDAIKNLGLLLIDIDRLDEAEAQLRNALHLNAQSVSVLTALGNLQKKRSDYEAAIRWYKKALAINPNYTSALNNLGLAYKECERLLEAEKCYMMASRVSQGIAEIDYNYGNVCFELGRFDEAEQKYMDAIAKRPDYLDAHETLNEFYWQLKQPERFGQSYESVLSRHPDNEALYQSYAKMLISARDYTKADELLNRAVKNCGFGPFRLLKAKIMMHTDRLSEARDMFLDSLAEQFDHDEALQLVKLAIYQKDVALAHKTLDQCRLLHPYNQENLALRSLCWRFEKNARYHWLIDYQKFIRSYDLEVPSGYSSLPEYLQCLHELLLSMHKTGHEPLTQTLKRGTQTPGRLLHKPFEEIAKLKAGLGEIVAQYIDELSTDNEHPLLSRKSPSFSFSGSWSVNLKSGGFHVNHVHPAGWISSSFYVYIPTSMQDSKDDEKSGCIKFGESPFTLGDWDTPERIIRPRAGQLVLFPSYTWHGTFPFEGDQKDYRLTAPFDVVPESLN